MKYRMTAENAHVLRLYLEPLIPPEELNAAIREEDLQITLACFEHGPLSTFAPMCDGTTPPHHVRRVVIDHSAIDAIEASGTPEIRAAIALARTRLE